MFQRDILQTDSIQSSLSFLYIYKLKLNMSTIDNNLKHSVITKWKLTFSISLYKITKTIK